MKIPRSQLKTYRHDSHSALVKCGKEYFETLEKLIDEAKEEIQFQTYIFDNDETGQKIFESLKRAAKRNIKVYLVVDSFGLGPFGKEFFEEMKKHKISFRRFSPFFSRRGIQVGRRLHHKVIVVDEKKALIGGINIADKYHGNDNEPPWLDFSVLLEGNICNELAAICQRIERKKIIVRKKKTSHKHSGSNEPLIRIRQNDWVRQRNQIRESYKMAIRNAEESITIIASYFIPGVTLRRVLRKASRRGVKIKLILSGTSDVPFIKAAQRFLYGWLLHINIRVFEYQPAVLHGKAMMVDEEWVTIGSYNLNHLSDYSSIELNADIFSEKFASTFNDYLQEILDKDCIEITDRMVSRKKYFLRFTDWFSYQLVRLNMSLLFFFLTKRGRNSLE